MSNRTAQYFSFLNYCCSVMILTFIFDIWFAILHEYFPDIEILYLHKLANAIDIQRGAIFYCCMTKLSI